MIHLSVWNIVGAQHMVGVYLFFVIITGKPPSLTSSPTLLIKTYREHMQIILPCLPVPLSSDNQTQIVTNSASRTQML